MPSEVFSQMIAPRRANLEFQQDAFAAQVISLVKKNK